MAKKTADSSGKKSSGSIWLAIMGGIFLLAGLAVIFWGLQSGFKSIMARGWERVEATIVDVEQIVSHGDDSTSYGVKGRFRYVYEEVEYQSSRFDFNGGTDNIGSYQQVFYSRLKSAHTRNSPVTAWVNPDSPENAVINRDIRIGLMAFQLIFGAVFASVGGGLVWFSRYVKKSDRKTAILQRKNPDKPWLWREEWTTGEISNNAGVGFKVMAAFALIWNLVSMPIAAVIIFGDEQHPLAVKILILLFPLVGLYLLRLAYRAFRNYRQYGGAKLLMSKAPFVIGGVNQGEIKIPRVRAGDKFLLTLSCIRSTVRRSGKRTRTDKDIVWQDDRRVTASPGSDHMGTLDYRFSIPQNLPDSGDVNNRTSVDWHMDVKGHEGNAGNSSTGLELQFVVPAFPAAASSDDRYAAAETSPVWNEDNIHPEPLSFSDSTGDWRHLGVEQSNQRGGWHYYFPAARNLKLILWIPVFGAVFLAVGIFLFTDNAGLVFSGIFGALGLLFFLMGLHGLFFRSEIRIDNGTLYVRSGAISLSNKTSFQARDIRKFDITSNMRSGNTRVYRLEAKLLNGDKVLLAKNLLVKSDVESLVNRINRDLQAP